MNILLTLKNFTHTNGGVCTHIIDLCREYTAMGHHVVVMAEGNDYVAETASISNLTVIDVPYRKMTKSLKTFFACYREMKRACTQHEIDVVHVHGQRILPLAWVIRKSMGIPFLWTNHINWLSHPKQLKWMERLFQFPIISVSDETKEHLVQTLGNSENNVTVVYCGVDLQKFELLNETEKEKLRSDYHINKDEFVISEVARLAPVKGQDALVRAIDRCQREKWIDRPIHVLLAGDGDQEWFEKNVMDYASEHNVYCSAVGFQPPRSVFGISDLSVLPSFHEGFPLTVVEAMIMKCPVIRSKTPGWSVMKEDALLFEIGDEEELARLIAYAANHADEMKQLTEWAYEDCRQRFTTRAMAERTLEVYRTLLK